jgi:hypothetical protein
MRAGLLSDRLLDAERQRDDVVQRLDSYKRASARADKDWELERNNLHVRTAPFGYAAGQLACIPTTEVFASCQCEQLQLSMKTSCGSLSAWCKLASYGEVTPRATMPHTNMWTALLLCRLRCSA